MLPHRLAADVALCAHCRHSADPDSISKAALRRPVVMEWPSAGGMKRSLPAPVWCRPSGASQALTAAFRQSGIDARWLYIPLLAVAGPMRKGSALLMVDLMGMHATLGTSNAPMRRSGPSRRNAISALAGLALGGRLSNAQSQTLARVGVLMSIPEHDAQAQPRLQALLTGLKQLGWVQDVRLKIDVRWGGGKEAYQKNARELAELNSDVIVASTTAGVMAVVEIAPKTPVVFVLASDPVSQGWISSDSKPGGNITGFTHFEHSIALKWLQLLREIAPSLEEVRVIYNPGTTPAKQWLSSIKTGATDLHLILDTTPIISLSQLKENLGKIVGKNQKSGLLVLPDPFTTQYKDTIIGACSSAAVPAIYPFSFFVRNGGLMSYGADPADLYHRAANYVDRILRGEKAGHLPIQSPTKFEFALNMKAASNLNIIVPSSLLASADEIIEGQ